MPEHPRNVGRVVVGFEQEGIVALVRVDGQVHHVDLRLLEVLHQLGLFFRVETEVGVDGEHQPPLAGLGAAGEQVFRRIGIALVGSVEAQLSELELSGSSWLPLKKSIHAEFGLTVRTVLGLPNQPTSRSAQLTISGSVDLDALGFYSSRGVRRAVGEVIAESVVRQIRAETLEAAKGAEAASK